MSASWVLHLDCELGVMVNSAFQIDEAIIARASRILARIRVDREGGGGTYADMIRAVAANASNSADLHRSLERVHERAERNVRDVLAAVLEAMADEGNEQGIDR